MASLLTRQAHIYRRHCFAYSTLSVRGTPFMIANDRAFRSGSKSFKCTLDSGRVAWHQPIFKYQSKCLADRDMTFGTSRRLRYPFVAHSPEQA